MRDYARPLADKIRPTTLDDVVGQSHILGRSGLLRRVVDSGLVPNMIFYGPSGTGKTTVASILARKTQRELFKLNATTATTADIREVTSGVNTLMAPGGVLLYLDEIQYFNKKQQQSLLEFLENGSVTLIASTTENPYFAVYNAILSRSTVFEFRPLTAADIRPAVLRAIKIVEHELGRGIVCPDEAVRHISAACGGDVRKAITAVELLTHAALGHPTEPDAEPAAPLTLTLEDAQSVTQASAQRYDRDGDAHYDILSAFQKSIRGSDPDAGLHYLARLLSAGDLLSACRRLLVIASEDVGLAYPQAVMIVKACVDSALQLGLPEAQLPLGQAVVLLATAPKSNAAAVGIWSAMDDLKNGRTGDVPDHLKDSHYQGAKKLGRGESYRYAHDFPHHYVKQRYLPLEMGDRRYYTFGDNKVEQAARAYWDMVKETGG